MCTGPPYLTLLDTLAKSACYRALNIGAEASETAFAGLTCLALSFTLFLTGFFAFLTAMFISSDHIFANNANYSFAVDPRRIKGLQSLRPRHLLFEPIDRAPAFSRTAVAGYRVR